MPETPELDITHHPVPGRFLVEVDGFQGHLDYEVAGDRLRITHTRVPGEIGGRGIGGALVRAAVEHAGREGLQVEATCSFAEAWLREHGGTGGAVGGR
ncbi:GNAT family N-acetyltransferase [Luteimonas pelagia]